MALTDAAREPRRLKLTLSYDGTEFHGWQVQPGLPTIQGTVEAVLAEIEKAPVVVAGSGRTDAGVHALAQIAAVTLHNPIPPVNLRRALNRLLPPAIRVTDVCLVPLAFHPRFDAQAKTYQYRIVCSEVCPPFERRYVHHHPYPVDWERAAHAARLLEGENDFAAFAAADDRDALGHSKVRTIFHSRLTQQGERVTYSVRGSGFLKHMVRNIVGTLIEAGRGVLTPEQVRQLVEQPHLRKAGPTAPACGLFLESVEYAVEAVGSVE